MSNRIIDALPGSWFDCKLKAEVIDYLRRLPVDPEDRKVAFMDWCRVSGCECTAEDYSAVTGLPPGEV